MITTIKHYIKRAIGRPDPLWDFFRFEQRIHRATWERHSEILQNAELQYKQMHALESEENYQQSDDPVVKQGYHLKKKVMQGFYKKYATSKFRILIHLPAALASPAGFSLFNNLIQSLNFIGIAAQPLGWNESIETALQDFRPTVFLTSDNASYLSRIDWKVFKKYRKRQNLSLGLTASLEKHGNTPLTERMVWAKRHKVDFYYSFRSSEYLSERIEYTPFYDHSYRILSVEFGANPLSYYPVPNQNRGLNYVFLASRNLNKSSRYSTFLGHIFSKYPGFIDGPGWSKINCFTFNAGRDRYVYSRAKVGLNLHIDEQIKWACELNERTYMLAACGVPQLVDHPKLLLSRFSPESMFIADTPRKYEGLFEFILKNPEKARKKALNAQREVFLSHTTLHRAEAFVLALEKLSLM